MKKIPTLFQREFEGHKIVSIKPVLSDPSLQWVLDGEGEATLKIDGACCAIIDGKLYRRYDAKKGKKPPENAIPCCDPDPVTGHWPHWLPITEDDPGAKWHIVAFYNTARYEGGQLPDGTWEAIGPHFQGNPYNLLFDQVVKHGEVKLNVDRSFEGLRDYLASHNIEGIVFWKDGEPKCKIKRTDFGFEWPVKK